ncbi:EF-hand domain-containing protein [Telluria mixta]|uniref:EF-hand domain-containing protein n=1 Tax=Telluria mixta TaxID=34071 RepID=A0ABT2BZU2_9BURK|nr:EF-hand domain-containing protein [Telluria mixta]MCS0630659.1 EF-hand domain-containing protein [Telluria mixta]WEM98665.1 EF-hand domain-containing protein [Telluria mixta]
MVASISSSSGGLSKWADSVFSKLDTKNQGYIEKSDLQSALSSTDGSTTQSSDIDDAFGALDGDSDGKVTKSELTDAMTKLSDQLNAQFDAARVNGGGMRPDGPPPGPPPSEDAQDQGSIDAASGSDSTQGTRGAGGPPPGGPHGPRGSGGADSADSTDSTSSSTAEAADADGDGTVSAQEQAAYDAKQASETGESTGSATSKTHHERDPMREFAHALQLLKAYSDDSDTASTSSSVSVAA